MRWGVLTAGALCAVSAVCAVTTATAQSPQPLPPLPGFVGPYEISRIVRAAGFDPLAPPRREGATYVVRAVDFRGTLMRIVVDGRRAPSAPSIASCRPRCVGPMAMPPPPYGGPPSYAEPLPEFAPPRRGPGAIEQSAAPYPPPPAPFDGRCSRAAHPGGCRHLNAATAPASGRACIAQGRR